MDVKACMMYDVYSIVCICEMMTWTALDDISLLCCYQTYGNKQPMKSNGFGVERRFHEAEDVCTHHVYCIMNVCLCQWLFDWRSKHSIFHHYFVVIMHFQSCISYYHQVINPSYRTSELYNGLSSVQRKDEVWIC